ncbi:MULTISPECIES: hypothetical protein [Methylomonas]|uniref:Uncharacterized protein n=1 Tax=Methylomonas koyamae TaxID=702114 RepID=A0AA91DA60_9GAMM|nr:MULTISPECIES: hypothetical protein [Methylomonas]ANE56148.1 hypothetical protein AYM39_13800 [Methylomonas sp. DH-1]OAI23079.1 hypothetical protein A1356_18260 [Methylomonas koyamae]
MPQQRRSPRLARTLLSLSLLLGLPAASAAADAPAKTGYEVDGRTSASVLAAKRAHTPAKTEETGLAVYSGVFAIGLIIFFAQLLNDKK